MGIEAGNVIRWVDALIHARVYPKFELRQRAKPAGHRGIMTQMSFILVLTGENTTRIRHERSDYDNRYGARPETKCFQAQRHVPCQSLGLHEILVAYALAILLPQTTLFRFPTRPVIRQLGLVEQLPQPWRILLVGESEHGGLVLEVVQSGEDGVRGAGGPRACAC